MVKWCIREGWKALRRYPGALVGAFLIATAIQILVALPGAGSTEERQILLTLVALLVAGPLEAGQSWVVLKGVRGKGPKVGDLWEGFRRFGDALLAYVLTSLIILVGFLLLVVPGVLFWLRYSVVFYALMDRGLSGREAMEESSRLTKGHRGRIFLLGLALLGVNILGAAALLVGLLVTMPLSYAAMAALYEQLKAEKGSKA
ncbi:MAG: hypothetical protein DRP95_02875 [Candidatus Latescibacterota bacterium]|nr:MAG: hypothetical protein DRP95_02875 [Candidatus Latescibacterota bacterium]